MSHLLKKGQALSLNEIFPGMSRFDVWLSYDTPSFRDITELNVSAFMLDSSGKCMDQNLVYYNNTHSLCHSLLHISNFNITNKGVDNLCSAFEISLSTIPLKIEKIVFVLTHDKDEDSSQEHSLRRFEKTTLKIIDPQTGTECVNIGLSEPLFTNHCSIVAFEIFRDVSGWMLRSVHEAGQDDLVSFCRRFGLDV